MNWWFGTCRRYQQQISLLAVGALEPAEREKVTAHLQQCRACRVKHAELRALGERLSRDGKEAPELEVPTTLRRRWTAAVRESATERPVETWWRNWLVPRRLAWSSLGAMWALILLFRLSGPDVTKPEGSAVLPLSFREAWLVLTLELPEKPANGGTSTGKDRPALKG